MFVFLRFQSGDGSCLSCFSVVCERGTWARTCGECPADKCLSNDCQMKNGQCMPQCWSGSEVGQDFVEESYVAYPDITWEECSNRAEQSGKDYFTYLGDVETGMCKVLKDGFEQGTTIPTPDSVGVFKKGCGNVNVSQQFSYRGCVL